MLTEAYTEEEYFDDLLRVTGGATDEALARLTIRGSAACTAWMQAQGVRFQPALSGTLHLGRTNAFFLGGGKALLNAYYRAAAARGIGVLYDAEVAGRRAAGPPSSSPRRCATRARVHEVRAKRAGGGLGRLRGQSRLAREKPGATPADNFLIRGTPYNQGRLLRALLAQGVRQTGDARQCHAVAIDARAPKFDGGIVTRVDCVSLGIVVNRDGRRFYDEGEDFWPKRYAIWGRLIAAAAGADRLRRDRPEGDRALHADRLPAAAGRTRSARSRSLLELDPDLLEETVGAFNAAVRPGSFDHTRLDDCRTEGLEPPKSHWARPLDTPPFYGYPLRPGITFTYLGVAVDERAHVHHGGPAAGREPVRRGRDHGRQRAGAGLSRRHRHDHRHRVRPHRGRGGRSPCPRLRLLDEARRVMTICNACRYCEGHCAVFPAMEMRLEFAAGDLNYLANLCHDCGACFHHCQYAPPHEFAVDVPRVFAELRRANVARLRLARLPRRGVRAGRPCRRAGHRGEPRAGGAADLPPGRSGHPARAPYR